MVGHALRVQKGCGHLGLQQHRIEKNVIREKCLIWYDWLGAFVRQENFTLHRFSFFFLVEKNSTLLPLLLEIKISFIKKNKFTSFLFFFLIQKYCIKQIKSESCRKSGQFSSLMEASSCTNIPIEKLVRTRVAMGMDGWMDPFSTAGKMHGLKPNPAHFFVWLKTT